MDGVTDAAMRYMVAKYGHPDYLFTEFVSVDALHHATGERRERLLKTFVKARDVGHWLQSSDHSPIISQGSELREIAQIFGHNIEYFKEAAELIESLGFDGIDINMGCPMHKVEDQGSGAGLIRTPEIAKEIVLAVKSATKLPVSVKTRIGVDRDIAEEWMEQLMEVKPAFISLHGRTLRQLYSGSADWEAIGRAARVVHKHGGIIFGNGDVESIVDAQAKAAKYGVDGILIGRSAEGNPGIFSELQSSEHSLTQGSELWVQRQIQRLIEHAQVFEKIFKPQIEKEGDYRWFMPMRKHLAWYCKGFEGAVEMRAKLMLTNSVSEVEQIVSSLRDFLPQV
jgi:nifR3 family TIM-barrel protein